VDSTGRIASETLEDALRADTALVSLMHVNNEIGSINDIEKLGNVVKAHSNAVFHVDAAQSVGKFALALDGGPVDMLTFSAHKFFGLKGAGALIMKKRLSLPPLLHGGGQEDGFRSGTADTARAAALAKALRLSLENHEAVYARLQSFKAALVTALTEIEGATLNGAFEHTSPFIINCSISGVRPETILHGLAEKDLYISTVSACSSKKTAESSVVLALTGSHERAQSSLRISLSGLTTQDEVDTLCRTIGAVVEALRFKRK